MLTDNLIEDIHKSMWDTEITKYGSASLVPEETTQYISDHIRAMYVVQIWQREGANGSAVKFMNSYSLPEAVMAEIAEEYCGIESPEEIEKELKTERRADKWGSFMSWAKTVVFEQFTTEQLCEKSGFSYQTTLKYLQESPAFRKIQKGLWEVRDPKADREAEKL